MKKMKKIILIFLLYFCFIFNTNAINSESIKSFYITNYTTWSNIYNIPEGKDLLITKILSFNSGSIDNLQIRNNWGETLIYINWLINEYNDLNILIGDTLEIIQSNSIDNYTIVWLLINEWEDIESIINWNESWINKKIFNKETILEIYLYEGIIMVFIVFYTFIMRILGVKRKKKIINL